MEHAKREDEDSAKNLVYRNACSDQRPGALFLFSAFFRSHCFFYQWYSMLTPCVLCLELDGQIARARTIKEHYVQQELRMAKEQRKKGELRATGGILSLGLINDDASVGTASKGDGDSAKSE